MIVAAGAAPIATVDDLLAQLETPAEQLGLTILRGNDELALIAPLAP